MRIFRSAGLGALLVAASVSLAAAQSTVKLSKEDKDLLQAITDALGELTGGGVIKVAPVDSAKAELNYQAPANASVTPVSDAAVSTNVMPSNPNRKGGTLYNDSTSAAFCMEDEGTVSSSNFAFKMDPFGLYILPMNNGGPYTDDIKCIWVTDTASGAMRVGEKTP